MALEVTITDLHAGTVETRTVTDGSYLLVLADPCRVANAQQLADGGHLLTITGSTDPLHGAVLL